MRLSPQRRSDDSDYNPADADCNGRPPPVLKKPTPPISSSSQGRPRRKVGRPRKYRLLDEGYNEQGLCHFSAKTNRSLHRFLCFLSTLNVEAEGVAKKSKIDGDTSAPEEASSSGLNNGSAAATTEETAEAAISQSDSENKDPSSNAQPEEFYKSKRGRPSKHFLRNKYKKYINRK